MFEKRRKAFLEKLTRASQSALEDPVRLLRLSLLSLVILVAFGTVVYMLLEGMNVIDALYMTVITITTVGFGEVKPLSPAGRVFTAILIILGVGAATSAISNAISIALGPRLWRTIRKRTMERLLMDIKDHYIVCGYGRMGRQVIGDLQTRNEPFVLIDMRPEIEDLCLEEGIPIVIGDATRDETLHEAGIERARGLVAALDTDPDNVMTVLTARELNPRLFIVARVSQSESESKLRRAGANRVVSPYQIGGHRIALALLRPAVNDFMDSIFHFERGLDVDIGQLYVRPDSDLAGKTVATSGLRTTHNVNILAIQKPNKEIIITPDIRTELAAGVTLIVIGPPENIYTLERAYPREG